MEPNQTLNESKIEESNANDGDFDQLQRSRHVKGRSFLAILAMTFIGVVTINFLAAKVAKTSRAQTLSNLELTANPSKVKITHSQTPLGPQLRIEARDSSQSKLVTTIQSALKERRLIFRRADYSDPRFVKGILSAQNLEAASGDGRLDVKFDAQSAGGSLTFLSTDKILSQAWTAYFDRAFPVSE